MKKYISKTSKYVKQCHFIIGITYIKHNDFVYIIVLK